MLPTVVLIGKSLTWAIHSSGICGVLIMWQEKLLTSGDRGNYAAKSLQSCLTLCDPIDGSPSGSPIPGILQARTLEWVAISFSNAWKWKVKVKSLSHVRPSATPWTAAYQAPPSMGFSRQETWSRVPSPSPNTILKWTICYHPMRFILRMQGRFNDLMIN